MGKITYIKIIFTVVVFLAFGRIRVSESLNIQGYLIEEFLSSSITKVNSGVIDDFNVPKFKLEIAHNDLLAIIKAYSSKTSYNNWVKYTGELIYETDTFQVEVSGHGDTPSCHKKGKWVSLRINVKKGKVFGVQKFSFILFSPIGNRAKAISLFANSLCYPIKESKLVGLSINDGSRMPMFFEPSNKEYLNEQYWYNKIGFFKSAVQCYRTLRDSIKKDYNKDSSVINEHFKKYLTCDFSSLEKDLSAKHIAIQLLLDLNGHGITGENFVFVVERETNLGLAIFTRDDIPGVCEINNENVYLHYKRQIKRFEDEHGEELFFSELLRDSIFRTKVRSYVKTLVGKRDQIMDSFMEFNTLTEELNGGKFLDIYFNWRDNCETNENIFLPPVTPCMLNHNFDFWTSVSDDYFFWQLN